MLDNSFLTLALDIPLVEAKLVIMQKEHQNTWEFASVS